LHNQMDTSEAYALQAELLVDVLSTQKPLFEKGISEYSLIELLKRDPFYFFDEDALRDPLMLFKTHFILFHALYQLQQYWLEQDEGVLDIHALNIKLSAPKQNSMKHDLTNGNAGALSHTDKLAEYYLDWGNFEKTDRDHVDTLLNAFWQQMTGGQATCYSQGELEQAHIVLGISDDGHLMLSTLKRAYKKALQKAHPDKGGSQQEAQTIIRAYQLLLRYYSFK